MRFLIHRETGTVHKRGCEWLAGTKVPLSAYREISASEIPAGATACSHCAPPVARLIRDAAAPRTVWVAWDSDNDRPVLGAKTHAPGCYVVDPNRMGQHHEFRRVSIADLPPEQGRCEICGGGRPAPAPANLERAVVPDPPPDVVTEGRSVRVRDSETGVETEFTIVASGEKSGRAQILNAATPLAQALLGHRAGETVEANVPRGTRRLTIVELTG